ncbi:MAG: hypothetical protein ABR511_11085 [Acidimicrobiales bacterium]
MEQDAAEMLAARIAEGRPPPDVWRAAAERRAVAGLPAGSWYSGDGAATAPGREPGAGPALTRSGGASPAPRAGAQGPAAGTEALVLRLVRLPVDGGPGAVSVPVAGDQAAPVPR